MGPQRGHYSARQQTNDLENGHPTSEAGKRTAATSINGAYLTEKDQNSQSPECGGGVKSSTTTASAYPTNGHGGYYNNNRYNRDYPSGGRNFSSSAASHYKSRYQNNYATTNNNHNSNQYSSTSRDSHSVHSNSSATHHKNSGASSTTSSTTSSSYHNNYDNPGWRSSRNSHYNNNNRSYNHFYGYNKENSGYASNNLQASGNEEYTRITTPRQDVLFKKGYLSRPKRPMSAMEEGYLGQPLISQVPSMPANGDPTAMPTTQMEMGPVAAAAADQQSAVIPTTEVEPAINEDNSPLYFCPGYVDHNGFFHANPTFMPNTYDQYGQPMVMMPYPQQTAVPGGDGSVPFEMSDNLTPDDVENQVPTEGVDTNELTGAQSENLSPHENQEEAKPEEMLEKVEVANHPSENVEQVLEIVEPFIETTVNEPLPIEAIPSAQDEPAPVDVEAIDENGEPVNSAMPLDPASNSFYPQQSSMYPYYPMVFTPQQLPPNTSIIPLADLYYNESYAGLAAEIFGLTEQQQQPNIPSDSTAPCEEDQLPLSLPVDEGDPAVAVDNNLADPNADSVDELAVDINPRTATATSETRITESPAINETQGELIETLVPPIVKIDNAVELAANSNLKVDVEEFHPRIPNYPTPAQAAHAPHQRSYRSHPPSQYFNNHDQYPRRREDRGHEDYRRRKYQDGQFNRPPRKTFNSSPAAPTAFDSKEEEKKPPQIEKQVSPPPTASAQKTSKSANKSSKRAILESIKHIEDQNIDLSKTSIAAASTINPADSNQWLVKTKGKKTKAAVFADIPAEDMFEHEEEIFCQAISAQLMVDNKPEPIIRASTPVQEVEEEKVPEKTAKGNKTTPPSKQKKSPNPKSNSPTAKSKGKNGGNKKTKGATIAGSKGFEVIEPDFGVITRLKTEPSSLDPDLQEELEHILNMKDMEEELATPIPTQEEDGMFRKSNSLPKSPRSEKDNVIDLDDLEALERSLMDFDLSGELKERMIEIIQSELDAPVADEEEEIQISEKHEEVIDCPLSCPEEAKKELNEEVLIDAPEEFHPEQDDLVVEEIQNCDNNNFFEEPEVVTVIGGDSVDAPQEQDDVLNNQDPSANDEQSEQTELKILTSGINIDGCCTGSSSSSSSLSSPIPTDDGRDGSNSESDDAMTPPAILDEEEDKKIVLPSQLEGRLFPRESVQEKEDIPEVADNQQDSNEEKGPGITASVSKWLEEKEKEGCPEPILRIPNDPQVAKLIFKAMYGVDLMMDDDDEFETEEDDMDSLSADESDYEPDSRDLLRDLLGGRGISGEKRDNQVPIDTDSDYMSDGQNIKPTDMGKMPNKSSAAAADPKSLTEGARGDRGGARMCKVM